MADDVPTTLPMAGWRACDACGDRPLAAPAEGLLSVPVALVDGRRAAVAAGAEPSPALVTWEWGHRECFPGREPPYAVDGAAVDTLPRMMARTLDYLGVDWFLDTAWEDAVRRFYALPDD